jgi:DNA invertase Pin-like site-specific DNA recombinase
MTKGFRLGYVRVSTIDQNPDRQLQGIDLDKKFVDYASGKDTKRPQLDLMLQFAREGDVIIVHSADRLSRNPQDLRSLIDNLTSRGIHIEFVKEGWKFTGDDSPISKLLLGVISHIAEFERELILERQREGIAEAKKAGKYKGGKKKLNDEKIEVMKQYLESKKSPSEIAEELGLATSTFYKYLKEIKQHQQLQAV